MQLVDASISPLIALIYPNRADLLWPKVQVGLESIAITVQPDGSIYVQGEIGMADLVPVQTWRNYSSDIL